MKKGLSVRETVLVFILILILGVYYITNGPLKTKKEELNAQIASTQSQINSLAPKASQMDVWQAELDELNDKYGGNPPSIPEFNNINSVISEMSVIFDGDSTYSISFGSPSFNDHIASRTISIRFSCDSYADVIEKLNLINDSNNRYRINNLDYSEAGNGRYSVSFSIVCFEYSES